MAVDTPEMDESERQAAMDKLVPGLEPAEYGQMPASFYSNSQRVAPATVETDVRDGPTGMLASSSTTSDRPRPIRPPILPRDQYEGVDSDDETDEEGDIDEESEEEKPQVEGDIEIDMEEEQDEFLEFARQALGISEEQWNDIVQDRRNQGGKSGGVSSTLASSVLTSLSAYVPKSSIPKGSFQQKEASSSGRSKRASQQQSAGNASAKNPNLDSFEALMQAMDAELAKARSQSDPAPHINAAGNKGKAKATETIDDEDEDIEAAMEAELQAVLEKGLPDDDNLELADDSQKAEYNLIKNFLESFKSQGGLSGPVGNLAGRLQPGWQIPRDED